jgi:hypothetical protein
MRKDNNLQTDIKDRVNNMNRMEFWGGVTAAIGGILLAFGPLNLILVPIAYVFFLISAILLTIWSVKKKYKGILIMNVTYLVVDIVGFTMWMNKFLGGI